MTDAKRPMPDHDQWPAFSMSWDDNSAGPTDLAYLLPGPAGATGFVRNVDGHLTMGDGRRLRLWGLNICTQNPLPPMEAAPVVARRLAKFGVNCLRLHAIDHRWPMGILMRVRQGSQANRWWGGQDEPTRTLDPEGLARLDYFIYCCKQQGIYLDLNLNVARTFTLADGVMQAEQVRWGKSLTYFNPQLRVLQKEYAHDLITHVNPFTGLRYGDEPAIALIELVNENSLLEYCVRDLLHEGAPDTARGAYQVIAPAYMAELDHLWNGWLLGKYADREALAAAWGHDLHAYEDAAQGSVRRLRRSEFAQADASRFCDQVQFYLDIESRYFSEMRTYVRGTLGAKQLLLGTSDHYKEWSALPALESNATLDVMDGHFYWQHPRGRLPRAQWRRDDWFIANTPMVDDPDASLPAHCARDVVKGHPYIVSEINAPFPNDYASEFIPIAAAYGLLQDWDGVFFYDYDGSWSTPYWQNEEWRNPPKGEVFALGTNPARWPQFALGALMFLRGDVQPARETIQRSWTHAAALESLRVPGDAAHPYWMPHLPGRLGLVHRTELASFHAAETVPAMAPALPQGIIASDTGELTWENVPEDGRVLVDTPRHQAIIGRAGQRATRNLDMNLATPFAAVQLASLDGRDLAQASRMLLVASARVANTGMRWEDETRQSTGLAWGAAPVRIEPVTGTLTLRGLLDVQSVRLQPLDGCGQPMGLAERLAAKGEGFEITLSGDPATVWYLVEVIRA